MEVITCPVCHSAQSKNLGSIDGRTLYTCRICGRMFSVSDILERLVMQALKG